MTEPTRGTEGAPAEHMERTAEERAAMRRLIADTAHKMTPDELRTAAVAVELGTAEAMVRVPTRLLLSNVIQRADHVGKLQTLYEAMVRLVPQRG